MNVGNGNAEPARTNSELSPGYINHRISSRASDHGAGVNATVSRVNMTFVASDPLSELVWSPHNGLILKCADSSFVAKSPPFIWDAGPSKLAADKGRLVTSRVSLAVTPRGIGDARPLAKPNYGDIAGNNDDMDEVSSVGKAFDANRRESTSKTNEEGILRENHKDPEDRKTIDFLSVGTNERLLRENKDSSMLIRIPSSSSSKARNKDLALVIENETNKIGCSPSVLPLERLERTDENELPVDENGHRESDERLVKGKSVQIEASPAFSKGKVLAEGDASKTTSKEKDDDSSESVESCGSVGLFSVGVKRGRFEQQLILGSKRVKNDIQENPVSASSPMGSSFMNWISNMVKASNEIEPSLALALANPKECHEDGDEEIVPNNGNNSRHEAGNKGFGTFFRSIYCPKQKEMETQATHEDTPAGESKEIVSAERAVAGPSAIPVSCHGYLADVADGRNSLSSETRAEEKTANDVDNKYDSPGSLWIARFSGKSHEHLTNLDRPAFSSKKVDDKTQTSHALKSPSVKNKGAMASVFAKRLEALKHITTLNDEGDAVQTTRTCSYCGKIGHDLRSCSYVAETDRDKFVMSMSSYDEKEEFRKGSCIRCFQDDHWAISCPEGPMFKRQNRSQLDVKPVDSTLGDVAKGGKLAPSCDSVDEKLAEVLKGMFDAIRKLRLSRMDILKWMSSHSSLSSLDGFFLRLRLGKGEKGPSGTDYYVARISAGQQERHLQDSKRFISVNVGGKSCLVESKHISNQDFLKDELMAWCSTAVKIGGAIPSEDDLKAKFEERARLRF